MNENLGPQSVYPTTPPDSGMVWMSNPSNTAWKQVSTAMVAEGRKRGYKVVTPRPPAPVQSPLARGAQTVAKGIGRMLPPLGATAGSIAGGLAGGPLGVVGGAVLGGSLGEGGNQALQGLAGVPLDQRGGPMEVLNKGAEQGIYELMGMPFANAVRGGMEMIPRPAMKYALRPDKLGPKGQFLEDIALKHNIPVTQESLPVLRRIADEAVPEVDKAIAKETANPKGIRYSWDVLRKPLAKAAKNAKENDLLSMATERALQRVQQVLKYKIEGQVLTPARMQAIKRYAQEEAKKLYEARLAMNDREVGPMEGAYKMIADNAQKALEGIPGVQAANQRASEAIALQKTVWDATKRRPPMLIPGLVGSGAAATHLSASPQTAALGLAGFLGTQAAMSPQAMSNLALWANNPMVREALARNAGMAPRMAGAGLESLSGTDPIKGTVDNWLTGGPK